MKSAGWRQACRVKCVASEIWPRNCGRGKRRNNFSRTINASTRLRGDPCVHSVTRKKAIRRRHLHLAIYLWVRRQFQAGLISSSRRPAFFGLTCLFTGIKSCVLPPLSANTIPPIGYAIVTFCFGMLQPYPRAYNSSGSYWISATKDIERKLWECFSVANLAVARPSTVASSFRSSRSPVFSDRVIAEREKNARVASCRFGRIVHLADSGSRRDSRRCRQVQICRRPQAGRRRHRGVRPRDQQFQGRSEKPRSRT